MDKNVKLKLDKLKTKLFADTFKKGKRWKDYNVYVPRSKVERVVGLLVVVLEKDGEVRISTYEECFEYMDFIRAKKSKCFKCRATPF